MKYLLQKKTKVQGTLIAGNLSTFMLMLGTPYFPDLKNAILFLEYDKCEDKGLPSVQRMFWQLKQAGIFEKIQGLVFGVLPYDVQKEENEIQTIDSILLEVMEGYTFPVIYNAAFGHLFPSWILVNGSTVRIDISKKLIQASWK